MYDNRSHKFYNCKSWTVEMNLNTLDEYPLSDQHQQSCGQMSTTRHSKLTQLLTSQSTSFIQCGTYNKLKATPHAATINITVAFISQSLLIILFIAMYTTIPVNTHSSRIESNAPKISESIKCCFNKNFMQQIFTNQRLYRSPGNLEDLLSE